MNRQQATVLRRLKTAFLDFQGQIQGILAELEQTQPSHPNLPEPIKNCMDLACVKYGVTRQQLLERNRQGHIAWARQVAMYLAIKGTNYKDLQVGHFFVRERSGVRHAVLNVSNRMSVDKKVKADIEEMLKKL